jgi:uncharacterized ion transporter superfamily protein YfcC
VLTNDINNIIPGIIGFTFSIINSVVYIYFYRNRNKKKNDVEITVEIDKEKNKINNEKFEKVEIKTSDEKK